MTSQTNFRYVALADEIQADIMTGQFRPGEKLPSLRKLHHQLGLSVSTIHQAYIELEKRGRVHAREKSGFYVRPLVANPLPLPGRDETTALPSRVKINDLAETILTDLQADNMLQLGAAVASKELMPVKQLSRILKSMSMDDLETAMVSYDTCMGSLDLRNALAKQMLGHACKVFAHDIITTNGCLEAVSLCLRAVANPGDTILVESPVFHCFLQLIEDLNMYIIELPGDPDRGMDPHAFEAIVASNDIRACLLNTNFQNPLGSVMSPENRKSVLDIAHANDLPIIEDDIYGDLFFGKTRPGTFKSIDEKGLVLYCSSFSKTLAPGLRAGWTIPGKFKEKIIRLKLNTQLACPSINHKVAAIFLESGAYDRHLRRLRNQIKNQASFFAIAIANHFPKDTRLTFPRGGMMIWIELNQAIDTMNIYQKARRRDISILPGRLCSSSDRYKHCLRLNCGIQWQPALEKGIALLGQLIKEEYKEKDLI
ncbi:MAG: PLP-dependent aminotransferase family protein [Desulfobacter sp.]|nr:PLP-dependent aminotransferase family protein [Desulfobacter sp.]WDP85591.1 MAG: PLP-dependent aminotransferase family protein [Desulfobacter sp.]